MNRLAVLSFKNVLSGDMEVTRANFWEVVKELERIIPSAEFLAIDGEFTGLHSGQNVNAFDTPAQYYTKLRIGGMNFLLIQFGLCLFYYDKEKEKYLHRAYNFYIFPKPLGRSAPDPRFLCQSSSMEFLASQGFDFNKLFKEGIPYLKCVDEERLREDLEEKQKARITDLNNQLKGQGDSENLTSIPIPEEHMTTIENACTRIREFISNSEPEELELDRHNGFVRKLIYQTVAQRFDPNEVHLQSRLSENRNRVLVVTRAGGEEGRRRKEQEKQDVELQELKDATGFSSVIRLISQSGKIIVGHNMLLDLCHLIHQCYATLPEEYSEFKEMVHCLFPSVLDTKYMCSLAPFKDLISSSVLGHLYKTLSEGPFKMCSADPEKEGLGYSGLTEKAHEAGYDAYITGLCFITMANYLGTVQQPPQKPVLASSPLLQPFINKLFLMRSYDQSWLNLTGDDPPCARDHVFFVSFPKEWKISDLTQLFSPFGAVFICWLNDRSAYVALHRRDQAALVLKTLTQSDTYAVTTYEAHQQAINACRCGKLRNTVDMELSGTNLGSTRSSRWCPSCSGVIKDIPISPKLASTRKRRSNEAEEDSQDMEQNSPKRRRSHSFGGRFSGRAIEPIPEEEEEATDDSNRSKMKTNSKGSSAKNTDSSQGSSSPSKNNGSISTKEFKEDDCWE